MLSVTCKPFMLLSVVKLSVIMLSVIMLSVNMLSVIMLSVIMLSVIMLSVIMLSVIMLSVIMPFWQIYKNISNYFCNTIINILQILVQLGKQCKTLNRH